MLHVYWKYTVAWSKNFKNLSKSPKCEWRKKAILMFYESKCENINLFDSFYKCCSCYVWCSKRVEDMIVELTL